MASTGRRPIVGVIGSGTEEHESRSREVGRWLAGEGCHLLTGGGGGVMAAVSRAFHQTPGRLGLVIGVLPSQTGDGIGRPQAGYPNAWVEISISTHLPLRLERGEDAMSRNHINVLSSDALIALPGGLGTASEVRLALRYARPLIAYLNDRNAIPELPTQVLVSNDLEEVKDFVTSNLARARSHTTRGEHLFG